MRYERIGKVRLARFVSRMGKGDVLMDKAFNPYAHGITRYSLAFWEMIKKHVDVTGFTQAKMVYTPKPHDYSLILTHKDGFKVKFTGVSAGYGGEGSRGTHEILSDIGFSNPERVFEKQFENFTMKRKVS